MREKVRYEQLECILTDDELKNCAKEMAEAFKKKEQVESELQTFKSQKKGEIDGHDATIKEMSYKVSSGKEFRRVKCSVVYEWDKKEKTVYREDTGDLVCVDIITEYEIQEEAELNEGESKYD